MWGLVPALEDVVVPRRSSSRRAAAERALVRGRATRDGGSVRRLSRRCHRHLQNADLGAQVYMASKYAVRLARPDV